MQSNLYDMYCSSSRVTLLQRSGGAGAAENRGKPVMCVSTGTVYRSIAHASEVTKVSKSSIVNCCRGRAATAGRMVWTYLPHVPQPTIVRIRSFNGSVSEHKLVGF